MQRKDACSYKITTKMPPITLARQQEHLISFSGDVHHPVVIKKAVTGRRYQLSESEFWVSSRLLQQSFFSEPHVIPGQTNDFCIPETCA